MKSIRLRTAKLVISASLLAIGLTSCASIPGLRKPEIRGIHPKIKGLDFQGIDLAFDVDVNNPYPVPIKTPKFRYGFMVEQTSLVSQKEADGIDLPAGKVGTATLPMRISYLDLWKTVSKLSSANEAAYKLDGALVLSGVKGLTDKFELPFSHEGKFPIVKPPTFSIVQVQPSDITLTKAKVGVAADVTNPNVFGIGLGDLGYDLKLGDIKLGGLSISGLKEIGAGEKGRLNFSGETSAWDGLRGLLAGGSLGAVKLQPIGAIKTPYGAIKLPDLLEPPRR